MRALLLILGAVGLAVPFASHGMEFDSEGVSIHFVDHGAGEPVVLVHGYTSDIEAEWVDSGVLPNLSNDYRVIALDLRGHGSSGKPTLPEAYGSEMAQDVARLLDHLGIQRAHIVGYSLGAVIVAKLLTTNPDRFITATLGGAAGRRNWSSEDQQAVEAAALDLEGDTPFRAAVLSRFPPGRPRPDEAYIRQQSDELLAGNDPVALAAYNRSRADLVTSEDELATVSVPVLGIVGSADGNLNAMRELSQIVPSFDLVVIDGATHGGNSGAYRTPEFISAVRKFIDTR